MTFTNGGDAFLTTDGGANWRSILAPQSQLTPEGQYTTNTRSYSTSSETSVWGLDFVTPQDIFASCTDCTALQDLLDGGVSWDMPIVASGSPEHRLSDCV